MTIEQFTITATDPDTSEQIPAVEDIAVVTVPEPPALVEYPVHPFAASFPMLEGEELEDLVDDIRDNGLHQPIVLDQTGQLLDGRNRLKACQMAGVEPVFTTVDTDPIAYILGVNVNRRHLSKGQCAMFYARVYPEPTNVGGRGKKNQPKNSVGFDRDLISQARFVLRHAPDIAKKVMDGSPSLGDAYNHATTKKRAEDEYEQVRKQTQDGVDPMAAICARLTSNIGKWDTAFLNQEDFVRQVRSDLKEIIEHAKALAEII